MLSSYSSIVITAFVLCCKFCPTYGFGYDYTVVVPAGQKECYYQTITTHDTAVEFEYQVLDQSPVNFQIRSPKNIYIAADIRKAHNIHPLHLKDIGIYEICIINRYHSQPKIVYLGLYSDTPDSTWPFTNQDMLEEKAEEAETIMEMSATEILKSIEQMQLQAEKMRYLQQSIRTSNVKDFIVQRMNFSRVNNFSGAQLIIMVVASVVQVYTIRKLFVGNSSKTHNMKMAT